ncbi:MAG: sugar ABC transporter permease [Treponema sp.]|nr:sugar ABC transporter permease [Treponema sp.]
MNNSIFSNRRAVCVFILPTLIVFTVAVIIPIIMSGYYSLLKWDGIGKGAFIGLGNYIDLFKDGRMVNSIGRSLLFVALSILVQIPISLIFALILASSVRGEKIYRTIYFIPVVISSTVIGQLWIKIYNADYGIINTALNALGAGSAARDWLGQKSTALICTFIPMLWQYVGYHMLILYAGAKSISPELYEAAKIDGSSGLRTVFRITLPMMAPILKISLTLSVIGALKIFDMIYVLTGGGPFYSTEVPSTYMYTSIFNSYHYGYGSAIALFIIVECLLLTVVIDRLFKNSNKELA